MCCRAGGHGIQFVNFLADSLDFRPATHEAKGRSVSSGLHDLAMSFGQAMRALTNIHLAGIGGAPWLTILGIIRMCGQPADLIYTQRQAGAEHGGR